MRAEGRANERFAPDVNGWRCRLTDLFIIVDAMLKELKLSAGVAHREYVNLFSRSNFLLSYFCGAAASRWLRLQVAGAAK